MTEATVLIGVDENYLHNHAPAAILSALDFGYKVHVVYDSSADAELLLKWEKKAKFLTCEPITVPESQASPAYYTTLRFKCLPKILEERGLVWVMDADLIMSHPLPEPTHPVMLFRLPWEDLEDGSWEKHSEYHNLHPKWVFEGCRFRLLHI